MRLIDADVLLRDVEWQADILRKVKNDKLREIADILEKGIIAQVEKIPTINPEPQWIPCSERVPEQVNKSYWVCTDTGYQCQCRWTNNLYGFGESDEWEWKIFDIPQYTKVIAWMPLPEPYKGGSE